ncbi:MAG: tRNA uridine-5-carboxymethylaminomethyl(34) synthesis GTPase MnmE [Clostridium sp.]|nr:tRNA uridine-5-carboxymethylaminomethyl(34) synthesis GTPase MnmE [Clostridium sp.]
MTDTIAAQSTAYGPAAIGILRLSGPEAIDIAARCFRPYNKKPLTACAPRSMIYGELLDCDGAVIDYCVCVYTPGPNTYTGENTAELQCHGSPMVLTLGLESLFKAGARQATAGEFTRRAFLNGKLDLAQAEAVGDLLEARSRESARHAAGQLSGALSRKLGEIYSALIDVMAHFHAVLDYPDEDIDPFRTEELSDSLGAQEGALRALLGTCRRGQMLTQGISCAIVGRPNAGKSSLLNALAGYERAIVTDIPGTTRDTIDVSAQIGGLPFRFIDTAGLRNSDDPIEQMGVERSRAAMEGADLIMMVCDGSEALTAEDAALLEQALSITDTLLVWNKADLPAAPVPVLSLSPEQEKRLRVVEVSAKTGTGLEELERTLRELAPLDLGSGSYGELLTNQRQEDAARRALNSVVRAREALDMGVTPDALLTDVEEALSAVGELTGQSVREDITDRIFSKFCVGK